jgi:phosphoglycerate kinase
MANFETLDDLDLDHKIVLLRADLNVPMKDGIVTDDARLTRLIPTLEELSAAPSKIVILSHFGRPDGKRDMQYSLRSVALELQKILGRPVAFAEDCVGAKAKDAIAALAFGQILVLENTRFHPEEEANDANFAAQMASLGDIFIMDAFSASHRAHASTEAIAKIMPHAAGRLMEAELDALDKALSRPVRPVAALVGGSKISTKLDLLKNLISKVEYLVLGGGMANTFLAAKEVAIGKSLFEVNMIERARSIIAKARDTSCQIVLPSDVVVATDLKANVPTQTVNINAVPADTMILDIGPQTEKEVSEILKKCQTIVWNGPLGVFEIPPFDHGTTAVAQAVTKLTREGKILSVAGGGDTVSALTHAHALDQFSYVSTAGGAFLEWMEGKTLPGVAALLAKHS